MKLFFYSLLLGLSSSLFASEAPKVLTHVVSAPMQCVCIKAPCNCNPSKPVITEVNSPNVPAQLAAEANGLFDQESLETSLVTSKRLVCADGRLLKLAPGAEPPADCHWESRSALNSLSDENVENSVSVAPKLFCENGMKIKLAPGATPPEGCSWVYNSLPDNENLGLMPMSEAPSFVPPLCSRCTESTCTLCPNLKNPPVSLDAMR